MAQEILAYLEQHPNATIVEMGAGLSCQRRQMATADMAGAQNPWYAVDFPDVIELRQAHVPDDGVERRIAGDLNDFSWMDEVEFDPERELMAWDAPFAAVREMRFFDSYLDPHTYRRSPITRIAQWIMQHFRLGFFVHVDFVGTE